MYTRTRVAIYNLFTQTKVCRLIKCLNTGHFCQKYKARVDLTKKNI